MTHKTNRVEGDNINSDKKFQMFLYWDEAQRQQYIATQRNLTEEADSLLKRLVKKSRVRNRNFSNYGEKASYSRNFLQHALLKFQKARFCSSMSENGS